MVVRRLWVMLWWRHSQGHYLLGISDLEACSENGQAEALDLMPARA